MYPGCQCHLKYEALLPDGIWVNGPQRQWNQPLKFVFPIRGIKSRIQHLTCSPIYHRATIHHDVFLKSLPSEFLHHIFHQPLIIFFLVNDLPLSKLIQTRHTTGGIRTKNNVLVPCDGFSKLFLCFHGILTGYIQLFCKFSQRRLVHLLLVL